VRDPSSILIVRLGALGDIVHAVPAAAALRTAYPDARLDWLVDVRHRHLLDFIPILTTRIAIDTRALRGAAGVVKVVRTLRTARYDVALDLQGLLKSAVLARVSGARRVVGFVRGEVREAAAATFYDEAVDPRPARHVLDRGLALAAAAGATIDPGGRRAPPTSGSGLPRDGSRSGAARFPFTIPPSDMPARVRASLGIGADAAFVALNPGAAWPNKRWPAERFGALAAGLRARTDLRSIVLWGPGEEALARAVSDASESAAQPAPPTTLEDLIALVANARLVVSGDTGPLHLAAAVGAPIVGLYGPTDPARNGPWSPDDRVVSRSPICECFHQRRCHATRWCLDDVGVGEVLDAALARLS
jgi:heptosyltransferase-1